MNQPLYFLCRTIEVKNQVDCGSSDPVPGNQGCQTLRPNIPPQAMSSGNMGRRSSCGLNLRDFSQLFQNGFHFIAVLLRVYLFEDMGDFPLWIHDESLSLGCKTHEPKGSISLGNRFLGVTQQLEGQLLFFLEFLLCFDAIEADAEDNGIQSLKIRVRIPQTAGLGRSARRQSLWIKVEHDPGSPRILQSDNVAIRIRRLKIGRWHADPKPILIITR